MPGRTIVAVPDEWIFENVLWTMGHTKLVVEGAAGAARIMKKAAVTRISSVGMALPRRRSANASIG